MFLLRRLRAGSGDKVQGRGEEDREERAAPAEAPPTAAAPEAGEDEKRACPDPLAPWRVIVDAAGSAFVTRGKARLSARLGDVVCVEHVQGSFCECRTSEGALGWLPRAYIEPLPAAAKRCPTDRPRAQELVLDDASGAGPRADAALTHTTGPPQVMLQGADAAARARASIARREERENAFVSSVQAVALDQLRNLDAIPCLNFERAEAILCANATRSQDNGNGSYILWRPDATVRKRSTHRGFTRVVLSFLGEHAHPYLGDHTILPETSMMEASLKHPAIVSHKHMWRVGGEDGFTCFPAMWQKYHCCVVMVAEPWLNNDPQMLQHSGLLFPSVEHVVKSSGRLRYSLDPQRFGDSKATPHPQTVDADTWSNFRQNLEYWITNKGAELPFPEYKYELDINRREQIYFALQAAKQQRALLVCV